MNNLRARVSVAVADEPSQLRPAMSYDEFVEWLDEDTFAEWEDGKVVLMSPASLRHQLILSFLLTLLGQFVQHRAAGIVVPAPFPMHLAQIRRGREPDLLFVATANLTRLTETQLKGPADLVVEIVSPESQTRDRKVKFREYALAGVPEYWLIDPLVHTVEVFWLAGEGDYRPVAADATGRMCSKVLPGFWLHPAWLWEEPLAAALEKLAAIEASTM